MSATVDKINQDTITETELKYFSKHITRMLSKIKNVIFEVEVSCDTEQGKNAGSVSFFRIFTGTIHCVAMLRIHDILVWIRIRGSMPLTNGSGYGSDPVIFVIDLQDANKKIIFYKYFFCLLLFEGTFTLFSKIKSPKESQNSRNQGFSYYFS
jgi:hypothetical protein